ncbi:MAG TPA: hypothetical protein PLN02_03325 [Azonexus sp.]|jgi:hypothetical protein|uniref:hypothetical protein n=1 Tax=Azonexus caeni TaxID=266126 RepID=UPI002BAF394C|nr:hypothetical protein [Azonexus sp.]
MKQGKSMELTAEQLVARTMYLLSRAATVGVCAGRVRALIQHLECVASDETLDPAIRSTSRDLIADWRAAQVEQFGEAALAQHVTH